MLVVDDQADCADTLRLLLELAGHDVRVAYDGAIGLDIARVYKPQVIFSDIEMPWMDGAQFATLLRQLPDLAGVIIVAVSATHPSDAHLDGHDHLFDDWLFKPYGFAALQAVVSRFEQRLRR
jgi:DNA-binding response OmpR family regulator